LSHDETHSHAEANGLPYFTFTVSTALQLGAALAIFYWVAPEAFLAEFSRPWLIVMWTALFGLPMSLFEYLYHRYLLHSAVLPFLGSMHKAHGHHHGLTNVKAAVKPGEPDQMVQVDSKYPIEHEHQEESMMFPLYAASIFYGMFTVLFGLPAILLFNGQPVVVSLLFAVTLCYAGYEIWHAIVHLPFERYWKPMMESRYFGKATKHAYGFHLMHHWRPTCNLAVVGLWGFAVWDHVFGTHRRPDRLPLQGADVTFADAQLRRPRFPIAQFDKVGASWYKWSRKVEGALVRFFTRNKAH
jgi:hypothetical protein